LERTTIEGLTSARGSGDARRSAIGLGHLEGNGLAVAKSVDLPIGFSMSAFDRSKYYPNRDQLNCGQTVVNHDGI